LLLIENVVDDLKGQADRLSESAEGVELSIGGVAEESAEKLGAEILEREVKRRRLARPDATLLAAAATALNLTDSTHLLASIVLHGTARLWTGDRHLAEVAADLELLDKTD